VWNVKNIWHGICTKGEMKNFYLFLQFMPSDSLLQYVKVFICLEHVIKCTLFDDDK